MISPAISETDLFTDIDIPDVSGGYLLDGQTLYCGSLSFTCG